MKFPISFAKDTSYAAVHTPLGSLMVHREYSWLKPWFFGRGERLGGWIVRVPLPLRNSFEFKGPTKSYRELVDAPKYLENLNWIIDEFDSSFNALAIASLRYHLDFSICDNESRREKYEDLIARLSEEEPDTTEGETAAIDTWDILGDSVPHTDENGRTFYTVPSCTDEARAAFDSWQERKDAHHERIQQARKDFVDVMPYLWS